MPSQRPSRPPVVAESVAADLLPSDIYELTDDFEHTFEICDTLAEALRNAPEYGCERIDVLRLIGKSSDGVPLRRAIYELDLPTAREVTRCLARRQG